MNKSVIWAQANLAQAIFFLCLIVLGSKQVAVCEPSLVCMVRLSLFRLARQRLKEKKETGRHVSVLLAPPLHTMATLEQISALFDTKLAPIITTTQSLASELHSLKERITQLESKLAGTPNDDNKRLCPATRSSLSPAPIGSNPNDYANNAPNVQLQVGPYPS